MTKRGAQRYNNRMVINNTACKKYADFQSGLCDFLFGILNRLNVLENEIFSRSELGEEDLWGEYSDRYLEIIRPACTEKQLKRFHTPSFGSPSRYGYTENCTADFVMKSASRAEIITHYSVGVDKLDRFVLKNTGGVWLVDEVYYGFVSDFSNGKTKWYTDHI